MRRDHVLMAVAGFGSLGALLLAQPDPGGGLNCFVDQNPVPGACTTGNEFIMQDPNCQQDPVIEFSDPCPKVNPSLSGFSQAIPQGIAGCAYRYYVLGENGCELSDYEGFNITCKAAGGTSCGGGGGGGE